MTVYITGDIHGDSKEVQSRISQINSPCEDDIIIICGDAGLEYGSFIMGSAKKAMKEFPGRWIIMRGNHDNRYWEKHTAWRETSFEFCQVPDLMWHFMVSQNTDKYLIEDKYPNILYIQDEGGIYTIDGHQILFIPGAFSVDGKYRIENFLPYEPKEMLNDYELSKLLRLAQYYKPEFVIGHTYPRNLEPVLQYLFMSGISQNEVNKNMENKISKILEECENSYKHYFFGHIHDDKEFGDKYTMLYHSVVSLDNYL